MTRRLCCDQDYGGSHYHCAKCEAVTGMFGHYTNGARIDGRWVKFGEGVFTCQPEYEAKVRELTDAIAHLDKA